MKSLGRASAKDRGIAIAGALCSLGCLFVLYWPGLRAWFQQDDFAWLALRQRVGTDMDWTTALFRPFAQGTVRLFSERMFFLFYRSWFDLHALPYHLTVFLIQGANLVLLSKLIRRAVSSPWPGIVAAMLWVTHGALAWTLTWASAFNEVLCAFVFLNALCLFASGRQLWAGLVFLLGFGVLELNVVFPALALWWALLFAPSRWRWCAMLFLPSAAFAPLHSWLIPKSADGVYGLALDGRIFRTLWAYWKMTVWPSNPEAGFVVPMLTFALAFAFAWACWQSEKLVPFGLGWFTITLAPYLLLPNHVKDYYLTVPLAGFAMAVSGTAWAVSKRFTWSPLVLAPALIAVAAISGLASHRSSWRSAADSWEARSLVLGVRQIASTHPGKTIYLAGITDNQFWNSFYDHPFRLVTSQPVYLAPDNVETLMPFPEICDFHAYSQPVSIAIRELGQSRAVVFQVAEGKLTEATAQYLEKLRGMSGATDAPKSIPLGDPEFSYLLKGGWHVPENGYRWMAKSAQVTLGRPSAGDRLKIQFSCAEPVELTVSVNGARLRTLKLAKCDSPFRIDEPLEALRTKGPIEVGLEVDHTTRVGADQRDLGVSVEYIRLMP